MIKDEDVIKSDTGKYMKSYEKVLYILAVIFGIILAIVGAVMLAVGGNFLVWGIVLLAVGICEVIGVGLLLWTEGIKNKQ